MPLILFIVCLDAAFYTAQTLLSHQPPQLTHHQPTPQVDCHIEWTCESFNYHQDSCINTSIKALMTPSRQLSYPRRSEKSLFYLHISQISPGEPSQPGEQAPSSHRPAHLLLKPA